MSARDSEWARRAVAALLCGACIALSKQFAAMAAQGAKR